MKQAEETNSQIGLEEQNYILKTWRDLKDSIFNVLFVMLDKDDDEEDETIYGLAFESGADYLQMLAFPFDATIIAVWNGGDTLEKVFQVFSRFNISTYLPGVSFSTFLILLYSLILLIILVLLDIIYVSYSFSKKKFRFTWPLVILAQLVPLFVTILFLPITQTLLSVVQCQNDQKLGYQVMISFPDIVCWQGWHLFHAAVTLLFSSLFVFISSVVALALFEPRMATKKLTARQNSTGQIVFIMNKIICQLVFSFNPFQQEWVYSVMLFCLSGWLYWTYNMNDPFYNKKASKFFRIVSSYYFWTNFMLMVSQVLKPVGFNGGLAIWISGLPFIGIVILFEHKSNIDQLFSSNLKFKSGRELESHLVYVLQLVQQQDENKNAYMLMTGYIEKHKEICVEDDCPFKTKKKRNRNMTQKEDLTEKLLRQLERMYRLGIKKYPNCTRLRLSFAFFQLERLKNKNKAYEELTYAQKTDPTFEEEFIIYRFKKIIRENLESEGEENSTDLIEIIRFDNHISLCEEAMLHAARLHKQFWAELKEETPDLKKLNALGSRITKTTNTVRENYLEISKINSSVPEVLHCYAVYLTMVANQIGEGKKLFEASHKIYTEKASMNTTDKKQLQSDITDESQIEQCQHPTLIVQAKKGSEGKIMNTNLLFTELSGYLRREIIERNIEKIMPDILCMGQFHSDKIIEWVERKEAQAYEEDCTQSNYIGQKNFGYIKQKLGYISPVEYKVVFSHTEQKFIVTFKNISYQKNTCHLVLDSNGVIRDCSYMANVLFGLDKGFLESKEVDMEEFFGVKKIDKLADEHSKEPFQFEIHFKGERILCEIKINKVMMKVRPDFVEEEASQIDGLLSSQKLEKRCIGYYVIMEIIDNKENALFMVKAKRERKNTEESRRSSLLTPDFEPSENQEAELAALAKYNEQNEMDMFENEFSEEREENIMDLYQDPNMMDILISNLAEQKTIIEKPELFELKTKIKTMRLLKNQIKMVYDQMNNAQFDKGDSQYNDEDDYGQSKLNDEGYHDKIRAAINTKLTHMETSHLRALAFIFLLILIGVTAGQMIVSPMILSTNSEQGEVFYYKAKEMNFLNKAMTATVDPQVNAEETSVKLKSHQVELQSSEIIELQMDDGSMMAKNTTDQFVYFYSRLEQYFRGGGVEDITILHKNFINIMIPTFLDVKDEKRPLIIVLIGLTACSLLLSVGFLVIWIYLSLKIQKKKIGIILWFLNIPISYVSYLGDHCDSYLKNFLSIKEVMSKGIVADDTRLYFDEYQDDANMKENELEEQQKARKTLIMKQRKSTLFSRINLSYFKMGWVVLFGTLYSIICVSQIETVNQYYEFLQSQWVFTYKSVIWADSISLSSYLHVSPYQDKLDINIRDFMQASKDNFVNSLVRNEGILKFNEDIMDKSNDSNYKEFSNIYTSVYFTNLCDFMAAQTTQCKGLVESSLQGGYRVYQTFISHYKHTDMRDLKIANEQYGAPALLSILEKWMSEMDKKVHMAANVVSIVFYIFIFVGVLGFLVCWLLYMAKVNTEINEAIRMLNMIPFKLLSNARKETREFIVWIIREANMKNHKIH